MDRLRAMQTFVAIADAGSLTSAARVLGASLPAVVRTLAALEAHLGVRLFNRTTRRLSLTTEGRSHIASCRQLLAGIDEAEAALRRENTEPAGALTITAPVLFGQMYIAPLVTRFVQRYPKVTCRLLLLDRLVDLVDEGIDVGIRIGELADSSLVARTLGEISRIVVASPDYLNQRGIPKHPRDLLDANCVRFIGATAPWWTFLDGKRKFTLSVTGNLEFNHAAPAVEACAAGLGFGMFISYQAAPYLADGRLVRVLENFEPSPRSISVVYPHARLLPTRTRVFVDWIRKELLLKEMTPTPRQHRSKPAKKSRSSPRN
ncbi:MAG: LysR family transcriptional regulator [Sulfuritalea sp.]|nr:LysR family transcriptional regulator [Sulfuritalea sp.]